MKSMCDYPFILDGDPNRTRLTTADPNAPLDYGGFEGNKSLFPRVGTAASAQRNNKSFSSGGVNESSLAGKGGMPIIRQAEALDENRIVLYKKGK